MTREESPPRPWRGIRLGLHLLVLAAFLAIPITSVSHYAQVDELIRAKGQIDFLDLARVTTRIAARIDEVKCREGEKVKRGDVLLVLDQVVVRSRLEELRANMDQRRSQRSHLENRLWTLEKEYHPAHLQNEQRSLDVLRAQEALSRFRLEKKRDLKELLSQEELALVERTHEEDVARVKAKEAEIVALQAQQKYERQKLSQEIAGLDADLRVLEAQLPSRQQELEDTIVRSPIDGVVLTANPERLHGMMTSPGQTLVEIADPDELYFVMAVDELDISKVRPGHEVQVNLNAFPNYLYRSFHGTVLEVSYAPLRERTPAVGFRVLVKVQDPYIHVEVDRREQSIRLRPGLEGEGLILVNRSIGLWTYITRGLRRKAPPSTTVY